MDRTVEHDELDDALRGCSAALGAAEAHGLLCGRFAVRGEVAGGEWLDEILKDSAPDARSRADCAAMLEALCTTSYRQLTERLSEFAPLLPDDVCPLPFRASALAHWCQGFLHGLVSGPHPENLKTQLAGEPLSEVIKDMLEITRATVDSEADNETPEEAWAELVEYVRVAVQLAFEELAGFRPGRAATPPDGKSDTIH